MKINLLAAAAVFAITSTTAQAVTYDTLASISPLFLTDGGGGLTTSPGATTSNALIPNFSYLGNFSNGYDQSVGGSQAQSAGYAYFEFTSGFDPLGAVAMSIELPLAQGAFGGSLKAAWTNAAGLTELTDLTTGGSVMDIASGNLLGSGDGILEQSEFVGGMLSTLFESPDNLTQYLVMSWDDFTSTNAAGALLTVQAVPVPAGILLLGTAFAGAGFVSRRAKRQAA